MKITQWSEIHLQLANSIATQKEQEKNLFKQIIVTLYVKMLLSPVQYHYSNEEEISSESERMQ